MTYLAKDAILSILRHIPSYVMYDIDPEGNDAPEYSLVGLDKTDFGSVDPALIAELEATVPDTTDGDGETIYSEFSYEYETHNLDKHDLWLSASFKVKALVSNDQWTTVQREKNLFAVSAITFAENEIFTLKFDVNTEQAMNIFVKTNGSFDQSSPFVFRYQDAKTNPNVPTRYRIENKDNTYLGFDIVMVYNINARKVQYAIIRNSRSKIAPYEMGIVCAGLAEVTRILQALDEDGLFNPRPKKGVPAKKKIDPIVEEYDDDDD